jgi:perosamine synthetase
MKSIPQVDNLADLVVEAIRSVVGPGSVALHEPSFDGNEIEYLTECINSTNVSSVGKFVGRFEKELADFTGAKFAVAVVNGTAALHIALKLAGVVPEDEVLIPALTFVATANAVIYCNATPHFVDSEETTLGIDSNKLRDYLEKNTEQASNKCINVNTGKVIRAIVLMHTFGHPSNLNDLLSIAKDFNIAMVEDAAEALGSFYGGQHVGTFGKLGTFSFNGNKTITTGGGGAIVTNDEAIARHAKHLVTTAKMPHAWEFDHDEVGFNYRMPNLNAALGCAQLEQLPAKLNSKRELFRNYQRALRDVSGINLFVEPINSKSNYWLQTLLLDEEDLDKRDMILESTNAAGLMTRPAWKLISKLEPFKNYPSMDLNCALSLEKRIINIPSSDNLQVMKK